MSILLPLIALSGESIAKVIDKLNFKKNRIRPEQLILLIFSAMFLGILSLILVTGPAFPLLSIGIAVLIVSMVIISFAQNIFDFKGLSSKNLSLREPINNFEPILTSFIAFSIFPAEREIKYLVAIVICAVMLFWGSSEHRGFRIKFDRGQLYFVFAMICSSVLSNIYRLGLEDISPEYLFIFRVGGILLLLPIFFRHKLSGINNRGAAFGFASGLIYFIAFLARLYSIMYLGLNFTVLILLLGPALMYLLSYVVLKEKVKRKQIATSVIIILMIILIS